MGTYQNRLLARTFEKNSVELKALLFGQMPAFVTHPKQWAAPREVPVFGFHAVAPEHLDAQLRYLKSNGYRTLVSDDLGVALQNGKGNQREVALTFDDGDWTFWAYAFPLLKKHNIRATLFVIPAIVPDSETIYKSLDDVWEGKCTQEDLERRERTQPLCTWRELIVMQKSGIVDIQSHSLTHSRISISSQLVDFVHPGFDTLCLNLGIPVFELDSLRYPARRLRLGAPVFKFAPRMKCQPRFRETPELVEAMINHVELNGGRRFFDRKNWRKELLAILQRWPANERGVFETQWEMEASVRRELAESKQIIEERLGKEVHHFCYPWFAGCSMADRLAGQIGYRTVHYGPHLNVSRESGTYLPFRIRRISEEYLFRLPGDGRASLYSIWAKRVRNLFLRASAG